MLSSPPAAIAPRIDDHGDAWLGTGCKDKHDRYDETCNFEHSQRRRPERTGAPAMVRARSCARQVFGPMAGGYLVGVGVGAR